MIRVDFDITSTVYYIQVRDLSQWDLIENQPSIIEITLPGYENPITEYFDKYKVKNINSHTLGVTCSQNGNCNPNDIETLEDGIYTIQVKGSPSKYNKKRYYLKTDMLDMDIDKIIIDSVASGKYFDIEKTLDQIEMLKKGAESNLRFDRVKKSGLYFRQAIEMLENLKNDKSCYK